MNGEANKSLKNLICVGIVGIALLGNITADAAIVTMEKTEAVAVLNGTIVDQYDFYLTLETSEEFGMVHLIAQTPTQQAIFDPVQSTFVGGSNGGVDTWINTAWTYRYDWLDDVTIVFNEYTPAPPSEADPQPVALLDWVWCNNEQGDSAAEYPDLISRLLVAQGTYGTALFVTVMSVIPEERDEFVFGIPEPATILLLGLGVLLLKRRTFNKFIVQK